jgi:hypothetical protein
MLQQDPHQRLWLINHRNAELIHRAEQQRLASVKPEVPAGHPRTRLLDIFQASLGRAFAELRRALSAAEAPCDDPAPTAPHP